MKIDGNTGKRIVSTILQSRTPMFLPVKQLSKNFAGTDIVVENDIGKITLRKCKLTQVHRNIVDLIFSSLEPAIVYEDGSVGYVFSKYEILSALGHKHRNNSLWLERKMEEMRQASVMLETEDAEKEEISYQGVIVKHKVTKLKSANGQPLYGVVFSEAFMAMFDNDIRIHSAKMTPKILQLEHAVTQAFARACISHRSLNRDLDQLLEGIGVKRQEVTDRAYRKNRKHIIDESEQLKELFGIDIRIMKNGNWGVFYKKHDDVWFSNPPKQTHSEEQQALDLSDDE